jgi:hypothetical protein
VSSTKFGKLGSLALHSRLLLPTCHSLLRLFFTLHPRALALSVFTTGQLRSSSSSRRDLLGGVHTGAIDDTVSDTNATCTARKHKCTEAAKQVHTGTIATQQRHLSASFHSRRHGVLVFYDQCCSTPGKRNMTGTQEDISSMISFIKLVETNPFMDFHLKKLLQDRFDYFGMEENCGRIQGHREGSTTILYPILL